MIIPNALQCKELDACTLREDEISSAELMERAARRVTGFLTHIYRNPHNGQKLAQGQSILIFAGPGNNGGDGLAVARMLGQKGYGPIKVYLFNTNHSLSEDCELNAKRLSEECTQIEFTEVQQQFEAPETHPDGLIIDALFGTGLSKPLGGGYAALVKFINASQTPVVSIDMPSGLMCEDNTFNSPSAIVRASFTLTIGLPKLSLLLADNHPYTGQTYVLPIGLHLPDNDDSPYRFFLSERAELRQMLRPRNPFGHKGTFGNALLIAGHYGMAGAAILAAKACLKAGVGKVTVHTPVRNNDILQIAVPEAVLHHDPDETAFSTPWHSGEFQATAIGPGIGTDKRTALAFIEQASHTSTPLVVDADGINILGEHKGWISQIPAGTIFTPHPKEMQRLGICNKDSFSTLLEAINMARQHKFIICLKDHYTAVCLPDGRVFFNPSGNSGMATAGSGDVLTGIILALLAQGYEREQACRLGVYLHGLAGDLAVQKCGEHSLTASELICHLPQAFLSLEQDSNDSSAKNLIPDADYIKL